MSNTRSRHSLDDLPLEILSRLFVLLGLESAKDIVSTRLCSKKMYDAGVYNYLMHMLARQFRMMGSTRLLIVPKSCCGPLMLFIDLQRITSHCNVNTHVILLKGHLQ
uniref:F-box domain-containing protein n=1 Tax=Lactuca sativa TaxID=4236 RepID=A0A9R1V9U9_LACSA|nr:hypothetical protein LSAT_V11C500239500 [Lactuca sativa]